ncbi:hypothetical protein, partial [Geothermobacter ehrlichii]|uniref:hypothetical protein n=1 Tax=Geothermobacter ehrlichii TaxID=213224 RepID=UPI001CA30DDE
RSNIVSSDSSTCGGNIQPSMVRYNSTEIDEEPKEKDIMQPAMLEAGSVRRQGEEIGMDELSGFENVAAGLELPEDIEGTNLGCGESQDQHQAGNDQTAPNPFSRSRETAPRHGQSSKLTLLRMV